MKELHGVRGDSWLSVVLFDGTIQIPGGTMDWNVNSGGVSQFFESPNWMLTSVLMGDSRISRLRLVRGEEENLLSPRVFVLFYFEISRWFLEPGKVSQRWNFRHLCLFYLQLVEILLWT